MRNEGILSATYPVLLLHRHIEETVRGQKQCRGGGGQEMERFGRKVLPGICIGQRKVPTTWKRRCGGTSEWEGQAHDPPELSKLVKTSCAVVKPLERGGIGQGSRL